MSTTSGRSARRRPHRLGAVGGLADDLEVVLDREDHREARRAPAAWSSTTTTRTGRSPSALDERLDPADVGPGRAAGAPAPGSRRHRAGRSRWCPRRAARSRIAEQAQARSRRSPARDGRRRAPRPRRTRAGRASTRSDDRGGGGRGVPPHVGHGLLRRCGRARGPAGRAPARRPPGALSTTSSSTSTPVAPDSRTGRRGRPPRARASGRVGRGRVGATVSAVVAQGADERRASA